jgi:hypothetical protein
MPRIAMAQNLGLLLILALCWRYARGAAIIEDHSETWTAAGWVTTCVRRSAPRDTPGTLGPCLAQQSSHCALVHLYCQSQNRIQLLCSASASAFLPGCHKPSC